ncbi:MAG: ABC transporter permease [Acetobacteraceae bacterium]|nr:ABC transporter permease [Acetobacteraceae bacterium]
MSWAARRVGISILLVWVVATLVFLAIRLVPGDPAELLLTQGGAAPDPSAVQDLREQLGLDRPVLLQYATDLARAVQGDLGVSMQDGSPVSDNIARRLPRTLELIGAAAFVAVLFGVPAGTIAAVRAGGAFDRVGSGVSALALAVPVFVLGTVLVLLFAQRLHWVAAGGYVAFATAPGQHMLLLLMPALTIAAGLGAAVFRMTRAAVLDVAAQDWVRAARAKGLGEGRILLHHMLRNAIMPVVTVVALHMGSLLGGTVLVEYVFNWPGLSGMLVEAVSARDYPEVVGIILVISVLFVALNLLLDVLYVLLDPRVRHA